MKKKRSPEMIRAAYFMAKFDEPGNKPPAEMRVANWNEAYKRLCPQLGDGPFKKFYSSINNDRRFFLEFPDGRETDTARRRAIIRECENRSRAELWDVVRLYFEPEPVSAKYTSTIPDEIENAAKFYEGAIRTITVNAYERNSKARESCIAAHGSSCAVCGFDFAMYYGPDAAGYIHVHHLRPLSEIGEEYVVDPVADLRPVCPNCHAVIHLGGSTRSIEEVREMVASQAK